MKIRKYILFFLLTCLSVGIYAQKATVRATVEPSNILIGEHAIITIEAISPKGHNIQFPVFQDTLITGIEVLAMEKTDTTMTEVMVLKQRYLITSFDSTLYHIPYLPVLDGKDTLRTNDIGLKVTSPQLSDTTLAYLELMKQNETDSINFEQLQISDIKDILPAPFVWQDYIMYVLIPLLIVLVILLIVLIIYLIFRKRKKGYYFKPKVVVPPHIEAIQGLEQLKGKNLCQRGMEKEYYTQLTDILRHYVSRRFGIDALEMTSHEILIELQKIEEANSKTDELSRILQLADLVKFAKYTTLPDENDFCLSGAYTFVEKTKKEELPPQGQQPPAQSSKNQTKPKQGN